MLPDGRQRPLARAAAHYAECLGGALPALDECNPEAAASLLAADCAELQAQPDSRADGYGNWACLWNNCFWDMSASLLESRSHMGLAGYPVAYNDRSVSTTNRNGGFGWSGLWYDTTYTIYVGTSGGEWLECGTASLADVGQEYGPAIYRPVFIVTVDEAFEPVSCSKGADRRVVERAEPSGEETDVIATGTLARGEEVRFATPELQAGAYRIEMTGTGDADLYVRVERRADDRGLRLLALARQLARDLRGRARRARGRPRHDTGASNTSTFELRVTPRD